MAEDRLDKLISAIEGSNARADAHLEQSRKSQDRIEELLGAQTQAIQEQTKTSEKMVGALGAMAAKIDEGFVGMRQSIDALGNKIDRLEAKVDGKTQLGTGNGNASAPLPLSSGQPSPEQSQLKELTSLQDFNDQLMHPFESPQKRMERLRLQGFKPKTPV